MTTIVLNEERSKQLEKDRKEAFGKIKRKSGESDVELANRFYNAHEEIYNKYADGTLPHLPFEQLPPEVRDEWVEFAKKYFS